MTTNVLREVLSIGVLCLIVVMSGRAEGMCVWAPPSGELFTVPANGATEVPTDARLWVLVGLEPSVTVVMDGAELEEAKEGRAWRSYALPTLEAGQTYEYTVSICHSEGCPESFDYGPYSLTAGESPAKPPAVPELLEMTAEPTEGGVDEESGEGSCQHQIMLQDCYDVGPLLHYKLLLKGNPTASHFAVWTGEKKTGNLFLSTANCPAQYISWCNPGEDTGECDPSADACFNVAAYNEAGEMSEPVELCMVGPAEEDSPESDQSDQDAVTEAGGDAAEGGGKESSGGCGVSSRSGPTAGLLLVAVLVLLFVLGHVRRFWGLDWGWSW